MRLVASIVLLACRSAVSTELTEATWDSATAGKKVFVMFLAPMSAKYRQMKPEWEKLAREYEDSASVLVAEVNCNAESGKPLCRKMRVMGHPTLMSGDPADLKEYPGAVPAKYEDLKEHATTLGSPCGPEDVELCEGEKRRLIEEFLALDHGDRDTIVKERDAALAKIEADHKVFIKRINAEYDRTTREYERKIEAIRATGLYLLKQVHDHVAMTKKLEL